MRVSSPLFHCHWLKIYQRCCAKVSLQALHWRATFETEALREAGECLRKGTRMGTSSGKHLREAQKPSLSGERERKWQALEEEWNNWEMSTMSRPGPGTMVQGEHHCRGWGTVALATLDLTKMVWCAAGEEKPAPQMFCLGWIHAIFLKSQSYFDFMQQESNWRSLTAGTVFQFSCLMWWLRLGLHWRKLGWGQNQTILVSNSIRSPMSIPAVGRAQPCSSC